MLVTLDGWDDPDLELDRINNDRGYEPENLRFVTRAENTRNKRDVNTMSQRIIELEAEVVRLKAENTRLRSGERGAAQPLHSHH